MAEICRNIIFKRNNYAKLLLKFIKIMKPLTTFDPN